MIMTAGGIAITITTITATTIIIVDIGMSGTVSVFGSISNE